MVFLCVYAMALIAHSLKSDIQGLHQSLEDLDMTKKQGDVSS
jgi:hypothetical protein